ncbi:hypothetical protein BVRB_6g141630 [Beta vulgaris subsp. vulgaris]|nr:hypothetical protein BVRB_6g141630 [Beta vulgaris subsp. vulgaris]
MRFRFVSCHHLRNLSQKTVPLLWMVECSIDLGLRDFTVLILYSLASPIMCGFYVK